MRQWNVNPKLMCDQHLLGEHVEHHMFVGTLNKGISVKGYLERGLLNINSLKERHDRIAEEMIKRGMNHNSPLPKYKKSQKEYEINFLLNIKELHNRCIKCRRRIDERKSFNVWQIQ
jgi:hypothetical protein